MSSYTEEPEEWRPVAISILEKAGLPTSDRHVTKLMRDLEILDLEEDWQSLVWRSIEIRNLWDETRADLLGLANAIDCVGELMLKYRHSEFARDPQTGPFLYLRDDAHRALWEMRDAARKHAQLALKESKLFDQAPRRAGRQRAPGYQNVSTAPRSVHGARRPRRDRRRPALSVCRRSYCRDQDGPHDPNA